MMTATLRTPGWPHWLSHPTRHTSSLIAANFTFSGDKNSLQFYEAEKATHSAMLAWLARANQSLTRIWYQPG